jgi:hypothetical protein
MPRSKTPKLSPPVPSFLPEGISGSFEFKGLLPRCHRRHILRKVWSTNCRRRVRLQSTLALASGTKVALYFASGLELLGCMALLQEQCSGFHFMQVRHRDSNFCLCPCMQAVFQKRQSLQPRFFCRL